MQRGNTLDTEYKERGFLIFYNIISLNDEYLPKYKFHSNSFTDLESHHHRHNYSLDMTQVLDRWGLLPPCWRSQAEGAVEGSLVVTIEVVEVAVDDKLEKEKLE